MPKFRWEATTRTGETKKGTMEAADQATVGNRLRSDGMTVKSVRRTLGDINITIGTGVQPKDLQIFTRQLATMIDAGLPLVQCLEILGKQEPHKGFAAVILKTREDVESGAALADAMKKHPKTFDPLYSNMIAAGEAGGILDTILKRLAVYIEKNVKLRGQLKSAMYYPTGIMVVAIAVICVMLIKVIPTFEKMYHDMGHAQLPGATQVVINISNGFVAKGPYILGGLILFGVLFGAVIRTDKGRNAFDASLLRIPVIGSVLRKIVVARFTRTLGTLLSSGVPILDALEICGKTSGNRVVMRGILHARDKIAEGHDMATPLGESKVFPGMVVQMIGVGEQTGAMDQMLQKVADFYEDEVDTAVAAMTSLIEPIMMAFLGVVVGGLIIAMYLPIFKLAGNIAGKH